MTTEFYVTVTDVRRDPQGLLDKLATHHRGMIVKHGRPIAFVCSAAYFQANNQLYREARRLYGMPPMDDMIDIILARLEGHEVPLPPPKI